MENNADIKTALAAVATTAFITDLFDEDRGSGKDGGWILGISGVGAVGGSSNG